VGGGEEHPQPRLVAGHAHLHDRRAIVAGGEHHGGGGHGRLVVLEQQRDHAARDRRPRIEADLARLRHGVLGVGA